ncbi:MAG TPA: glycosyltransferase [Candidatus Acidoferrales bacterium]|nr:glycosyltransferase [Candidatus Acidoferrales bacterium]
MPQISAIIPARNEEENIEAAVSSLAPQNEIAEIIVVDDQSTDRTPEILSRLAHAIPKLKILRSGGLPSGWTGKNHALWLGAQAAKSDWLLFTDADTVHLPGSAARVFSDARTHNAALVSYSPEQRTETIFEQALIPFIYCRLARRFNFARICNPSLPDAAANGQFILIRRDAYEKSGGHQAISGLVLEDVALARRVKQRGFSIYFASGAGIARTRMYRNFPALFEGWTKNLYPLIGATPANAFREIAFTFPWIFLVLLLCGIFAHGQTAAWLLALSVLALILRHLWYARELKANRYPLRFIIYYSLAAPLYAALVIASAWKHFRGKVAWKGREYSVGEKSTRT